MAYTAEQKNTIEYLINRGKSVHRQMENCKDNFESERLQDELNYIKAELGDALNAEARFNEYLKMAHEYIDRAENIRKKWFKA